jgi:hypothetical protein
MDLDLYSDEEVAEREAELERDELTDLGYYDRTPGVCSLCLAPSENELCDPCADYDAWVRTRQPVGS